MYSVILRSHEVCTGEGVVRTRNEVYIGGEGETFGKIRKRSIRQTHTKKLTEQVAYLIAVQNNKKEKIVTFCCLQTNHE